MTLQEALQAIDQGEWRKTLLGNAQVFRTGPWRVVAYWPECNFSIRLTLADYYQTVDPVADPAALVSVARRMRLTEAFYRTLADQQEGA